jgi:hypothetical protein
VLVADSTSVDLFKVLAAALAMRPERKAVVAEAGSFPTDLYLLEGLTDLLGGYERRLVNRRAQREDCCLLPVCRPLTGVLTGNDRPDGSDEEAGDRGITLDATVTAPGCGRSWPIPG